VPECPGHPAPDPSRAFSRFRGEGANGLNAARVSSNSLIGPGPSSGRACPSLGNGVWALNVDPQQI
jgi:hypothetical protein